MRVLFWSGSFWPQIGGVEVLAAKFLPALRKRGYEYTVVAPKGHSDLSDEGRYDGIPVHRVAFYSDANQNRIDHVVATRQKVRRLKESFAPHLIHINHVSAENFFHLSTTSSYRAPVLVTLHGKWKRAAGTIVQYILRDADWVVGCSEAVLETARRLVPEIAYRSSVIYNGVEAPSSPAAPLSSDPPRILCIGRLVPEKGFDLALAAFALVLGRFPHARLIIAGDGAARRDLEQQAAMRRIGHAVEFTGWIDPDTVPSLINAASLVLMPSREDSLPLVALEAARLARPVIATRVGGLPEIVVHQQTGLVVDSENSSAIADAIILLLSNVEMASKLGQAALNRVRQVFDWERHVDAYDALYQKLGNGKLRVVSA